MSGFSPKIEILNHFDNLINRVDIEMEKCLEKYNEKQNLGDLEFIRNDQNVKFPFCFHLCCISTWRLSNNQSVWSESTKVIDYLYHLRNSTIEELKKAQEDSIEYYNSISSHFKKHDREKNFDEIKSQIFGKKHYFQVLFKPKEEDDEWIFNLFNIVSDFYMSQADVMLLEKVINAPDDLDLFNQCSNIIFDEKMVLIGLIQSCFFENMNRSNTQQFPNHFIRLSIHDLLNIKSIICHYVVDKVNLTYCPINFPLEIERLVLKSKLKQIQIQDFASLKSLDFKLVSPFETITLGNLISLQDLKFELLGDSINSDIQIRLLDRLPTVKKLTLTGRLSNFNLDNLVCLQDLSLDGLLENDFNYDLFRNLSNQLTNLSISLTNACNIRMSKLFIDYHFPNLTKLRIMNTKVTRLENSLFRRFQALEELILCNNKDLVIIDNDSFSNLKKLTRFSWICEFSPRIIQFVKSHFVELTKLEYLKLSGRIVPLKDCVFRALKDLKHLDLSVCELTYLNPLSFYGLEKLEILELQNNDFTMFDLCVLRYLPQIKRIVLTYSIITNKEEILNRAKKSNIEIKFLSI